MTIIKPLITSITSPIVGSLLNTVSGVVIPTPSIDLASPSNQTISSPDGLNAEQGTMLIQVLDNQRIPNTNEFLFYIGGGSTTNCIYLQKRTSGVAWRFVYAAGGVNQIVRDFPSADMLNGVNTILVTWNTDVLKFNINGTPIVMNNTGFTELTDVSNGVSIGQFGSAGAQPYQRTIQRFRYWPVELSDEQIYNVASNNSILQGQTFDASRDGYVFLGESNASGRSTVTPTYANTNKQVTNALTYTDYADPYDGTTSAVLTNLNETVTPTVSFAGHTIDKIATETGRETFAVPACRGGASTVQDYTFSVVNGSFDYVGNIGFASIQQIKASMAFGSTRAIIISLGVNDAILGTSKAAYKATLTDYISKLRASLQMPTLKIVYLSLHQRAASGTGATEINWNNISAANLELGASDPNGVGVDISDIVGITGDPVHFGQTEADLITVAERIRDAL